MLVQNTYLHIISLFIALVAGSVWLVYGVMHPNMHYALRATCVLVGIVSIYTMFDKHVYLPFLGESVLPSQLLLSQKTNNTTQAQLKNSKNVLVKLRDLPKHAKVVYWAADKTQSASNLLYWQDAYGSYENSGVVTTDENGEVSFSIECPQPYFVYILGLFKKRIPPHVHYRYVLPGTGGAMFSEIMTAPVLC